MFTAAAGGTQLQSITFQSAQGVFHAGLSGLNASDLPNPYITAALYLGSPATGLTLVPGSVNTVALNVPGGDQFVTVPFAAVQNVTAGQVFTAALLIDDVPSGIFPFMEDNSGSNTNSYFDVDNPIGNVNTYTIATPNDPTLNGVTYPGQPAGYTNAYVDTTVLRMNPIPATATLTVTGGGTFSGTIQDGAGTVALTVAGTSQTLTLSGSNNYSGLTTINSGDTLKAGSASALDATNNVSDGGTLDVGGHSISIGALTGSGSVIDSGSAATLTVAGGGFFTGNISGANTALTVGGTTQSLTLAGTDTYGGSTTINGGDTLQAGSFTALSPNSNVSNAGTLDLGGYSNSIGALNGGGTVTNNLHTYQIDDGVLDPSVPGFNDTLGDETTPSLAEDNWNGNVFTAQAGGTQLQSVSFYAGPNGVTPGVSFTNPSPVTVALYTGAPGAGLTLVASSVYTTAALNPAPDSWVTVPFASLQNIPAGQVFTAVVYIPDQPDTAGPWTLDNSGVSTGSYFDVDSPPGNVGSYNLAAPNSPTLNGASWESTGDSDIVPGVTLLRVNETTPAATLTVTGSGSYSGTIQDGSGTVALTLTNIPNSGTTPPAI